MRAIFLLLIFLPLRGQTWTADNGNGTYSNPLFYDEFSDPDMIRVGADYYLTGTTMHAMPGLAMLHSRDLVNWTNIGYVFERLNLGPAFRLEEGKEIYGQGIWAPCLRYYKGTFYVFANVNGYGLQIYRASNPRGPWRHNRLEKSLHDISVLFDDDGRIRVVWGAGEIRIAEFNAELTGLVPGTERVLIGRSQGLGEGSHFYKIQGRYYLVSALPGAHTPMKCARADKLEGPWTVRTISENESLGIGDGYRLTQMRPNGPPFTIVPPQPELEPGLTLHQGGIIDTVKGEWWGYSMQDHNSVGRLTSLSPVTWEDGWPYFGLPGNLTRTPALWVKPDTGATEAPHAVYARSDEFNRPILQPVWQWNHVPDDTKWSLVEHFGALRLHSLPAPDVWRARNTLTQRAVGPESTVTTEMDAAGMKDGDTAGLVVLNMPYGWIGVERGAGGLGVRVFNQATGASETRPVRSTKLWFRAACDFDTEKARFSYSEDGKSFQELGGEFVMVFQLKTFQGARYGLFHYNSGGQAGGFADFNAFRVAEAHPRGLTQPIPVGQSVTLRGRPGGAALAVENGVLRSAAGPGTPFVVVDRGRGRIALQAGGGFVSVEGAGAAGSVRIKAGAPRDAETFQWVDLQRGDILFLSLATHRYLRLPAVAGPVSADQPGPTPGRKEGSCFSWQIAGR